MDWDHDGRTDVLSGSWPGEIYFFRRSETGQFAPGESLKSAQGTPLNVGPAAAAHAVDWNGDGLLDLLLGVMDGKVYFVPRERREGSLALGEPQRLALTLPDEATLLDAAPVAAEWNRDGHLDLLVGAEDGSVWLFESQGPTPTHELRQGVQIVPKSRAWDSGLLQDGDWGTRVKICPVDFNGDGWLDLLMGDLCGGSEGKPPQTAQEQAEEQTALRRLPELRRAWSDAYAAYRRALRSGDGREASRTATESDLIALRNEVARMRDEIARCEEIQRRYEPQPQSHGFVWLWLRQPEGQESK